MLEVMKVLEIVIKVVFGFGKGCDCVLICDFIKEYVVINGDY